MPRYIREVDSADILHFGFGDIRISDGKDSETGRYDQLVFWLGEPGEIGRRETDVPGRLSTELPGPLFVFENIESLDVVVERLQTLRGLMVSPPEGEAPCSHEWTGQRMGGSPSDATSDEWVGYCKHCGTEGPED
jgi:hypothetical protein